jgi:hypothetical protein
MGIFSRRQTAAIRATAGNCTASVAAGGLAPFLSAVGVGRERAMAIPTISRSRDLLASIIAECSIEKYSTVWDSELEEIVEIPLQPEQWQWTPDARTTRSQFLAWLFDDLFFYGKAALYVTSRFSTGFPASFQWLPWEYMSLQAPVWAGNMPIGPITQIMWNGTELAERDVVFFWSPIQGVLHTGRTAICTAEKLDTAAQRFASSPVAMGWLSQTGGEPLSSDELQDLADGWVAARDTNSIAALNEFVKWNESTISPDRMQLIESRQHQALELARVCNISPFLVGAPSSSGMTYQNAQQAAEQLQHDAQPFLSCIEQTLSGNTVTPRGQIVRLRRLIVDHAETPAPSPEVQPV